MVASKSGFGEWIAAGMRGQREDALVGIETMAKTFGVSLMHGKAELKRTSIRVGEKILDGYSFSMYQPWYKAAPLGMLLDMEISLDGAVVPREDIFLIKGGQRFRLLDARTVRDVWWNVIEELQVFFPWPQRLDGPTCRLEVRLAERIAEYYEFPLDMLIASASLFGAVG
jgi:hypothetical protein